MKLAWGARVSPLFRQKVLAIANALDCDASSLMACMAFETGQTFRADVRNAAGSGATGLIQFMPSTAIRMGTTVDALARKTPEEQLDDVYQYLKPYSGRLRSLSDLYMAILLPSAVGKTEDDVLIQDDEGKAYLQNRGLDLNQDGNITKAEAASLVMKQYVQGMQPTNLYEELDTQPAAPIEDRSTAAPTEEEAPMGASLVTGLIASLLQSFAPLAQAKLTTELGRHTDAGTADQVTQGLMNIILQMVGNPKPSEATDSQKIAAVAQVQANPALLQQVEKSAMQQFEDAAPWLDKISQIELANRHVQIDAMNAAAVRAQGERWDMTPTLVWLAGISATLLVLGLLGVIIAQSLIGDKEINTALIGLAGPLLAISMGVWREIFAYRFDGTKDSAAQNAAMAQIAANGTAKKGQS